MIFRFLDDARGNFTILAAVAFIPVMGALALAVDYAQITRQRQTTMNALDDAGIATARFIVSGSASPTDPVVYEATVKQYAKDFFEANLNGVDPAHTKLTIVLPINNTGGGTLQLTADLTYEPLFLPVAAMLIGRT